MKVYYNSSLWSEVKGLCGLPQRVDWQFEYVESMRYIPILYRFQNGIVFDIITILDQVKLREFFEKYESLGENLTPTERICAEQEHPYQGVPIMEICIDGERVKDGYSSSSYVSLLSVPQDDLLASMRKEYSSILRDTDCFACERFYVPYPRIYSKGKKLLRFLRLNKINDIKLVTYPVQQLYPLDINFQITNKESKKTVYFNHPITGITHTLHFQNPEFLEVPMDMETNQHFYFSNFMYEIDPDLPRGNTLQFNSSILYTESAKDNFSPTATSSIGIIGRTCGPTSTFISKTAEEENISLGSHGLILHNCFSILSLEKGDVYNFALEGINIEKYDSKEYKFQ